MSLWEYANPVKFMRASGAVLPWVAGGAALCTALGLVWGFLTPQDYRQGATVKIIFLHVPAALMAINAWLMMLVASLIWLVRRHHVSALAAKAAAPVGAVMTLIALVTGAIWGQPMWGTWWVWDARLTSVLVLFLFYLGYMALRASIDDEARAARAAGVLGLVGLINLPIVKFSVDWWNTLHQPASLLRAGGSSLAPPYLQALLVMMAAYGVLFLALWLTAIRTEVRRRRVQSLRARRALEA